jgi:hypothetical protein
MTSYPLEIHRCLGGFPVVSFYIFEQCYIGLVVPCLVKLRMRGLCI